MPEAQAILVIEWHIRCKDIINMEYSYQKHRKNKKYIEAHRIKGNHVNRLKKLYSSEYKNGGGAIAKSDKELLDPCRKYPK